MALLSTAVIAPGEVPDVGVTWSQLPPEVVLAVAVNVVDVPVSVILCGPGTPVLPAVYAPKLMLEGFTPMVLTVSVMGTETLLAPPKTDREVEYVPEARPVGSAETVTVEGVVPLALLTPLTLIQFTFVKVKKLIAAPVELVTVSG
jgi:hypothetical protein